MLRDKPRGLSRTALLAATKLKLDALDESTRRLEQRGIVVRVTGDKYRLAGLG